MTGEVITTLNQVTSEWLTAVLANNGALTSGSVASFVVEKGAGNWSASARLRLYYTEHAQGALPQHLFLKMVKADASSADELFSASEHARWWGAKRLAEFESQFVSVPL